MVRIAFLLAVLVFASSAIAQPTGTRPPEFRDISAADFQTSAGLDRVRAALDQAYQNGHLGENKYWNDAGYRERLEIIEDFRSQLRSSPLKDALDEARSIAHDGDPAKEADVRKAVTKALEREGQCQKMGLECPFDTKPGNVYIEYRDNVLRRCAEGGPPVPRAEMATIESYVRRANGQPASGPELAKCYLFEAKSAPGEDAIFSGKVRIGRPFELQMAIPGGAGKMEFYPNMKDQSEGNVLYKIQGSGAVDEGRGTYTIAPVQGNTNDALELTATTGSSRVVIPGMVIARPRAGTIILTPL